MPNTKYKYSIQVPGLQWCQRKYLSRSSNQVTKYKIPKTKYKYSIQKYWVCTLLWCQRKYLSWSSNFYALESSNLFFHRMKVIRENFAVSNFFWTGRQIECFCLLGFKALWLMVTFLPPLNSADILIFHSRSIFRSLIFGPDFPNFLSTLNVSSFLQSTEGSSENEGIGRVCMGWSHQLGSGRTWHFILPSSSSTRSFISFIRHFGQAAAASLAFLRSFFRKYCPTHPPNPPPNLKISKWKEWQQLGAVWSDLQWSTALRRTTLIFLKRSQKFSEI